MLPEEIKEKRLLIAPLNWGMGHTFRLIPLLGIWKKQGNKIFMAVSETQKEILHRYFADEIEYLKLEDYPFSFSAEKTILKANFSSLQKLFRNHKIDYKHCEEYVKKHQIDVVISDHRYGFYSQKVTSIFLTHQTQLPINNGFIQRIHLRLICKHFQEVWLYDNENRALSGNLTKHDFLKIPAKFIGIHSRFSEPTEKDAELIVAIISGPKPYNQLLLKAVEKISEIQKRRIYCVTNLEVEGKFLQKVKPQKQDEVISRATTIISHMGYTTLMDLLFLKPKKCFLIPSPHQLEQEYLAEFHRGKNASWEILNSYEEIETIEN